MSDVLTPPKESLKRSSIATSLVVFFGCFIALLLFTYYGCPWFQTRYGHSHQDAPPPSIQSNLDGRLLAVEKRLDALEARGTTETSGALSTEDKLKENEALDRLHEEIGVLNKKTSSLETELEVSGKNAAHQAEAQKNVLFALAFTPLREAALSGHKFDDELRALKDDAKDRPDLLNLLQGLSLYAQDPCPSLPELTQSYINLEGPLYGILTRATAETWQDHALGLLTNFATVRPQRTDVKPNTIDALLGGIENKLKADDLEGAIQDAKNLPPAATETLAPWMVKASARLVINQSLKSVEDHLNSPAVVGVP